MGKVRSIAFATGLIVSSAEAFTSYSLDQSPTGSFTALEATRRHTFGGLVAGSLLPSVVPETARADDEYPYKVSRFFSFSWR